ncbi:MAG TPA: GxxExxY protein [Bacillota bacterium]|nr:GxxExxY protein [Bacillota bacterium]
MTDYKYSDITGKIIGCAMEVHKKMGCGFQELIYQRCLAVEFQHQGLFYEMEKDQVIYYKEVEVGIRRVDFLVEGIVMVELKAVSRLEDVHLAQAINYLEAYKLEVGLLINFGAKSLEYKRVVKSRPRPRP